MCYGILVNSTSLSLVKNCLIFFAPPPQEVLKKVPRKGISNTVPVAGDGGQSMSVEEPKFISYEEAVRLVGAIQEEEDVEEANKRILMVYSKDDKELCWFDFDEVMAEVGTAAAEDKKEAVQNYILHRIPDWVFEL